MKDKILGVLENRFTDHRIIFWYDEKQEFRKIFADLDLAGVEKIEIANNEFQVKYRILRQENKQKFLLYLPYKQLADKDNWLLDVELAHTVFSADTFGLLLSEFKNNHLLEKLLKDREHFLKSAKRREDLKKQVHPADSKESIILKMLAISCESHADIASILTELIKEYAKGKDKKYKLLVKSNLVADLWDFVKKSYGYTSDNPSIKDFLAELFENIWNMSVTGEESLCKPAIAFLNNFKDNRNNRQIFIELSDEFAREFAISEKLLKVEVDKILKLDIYQDIDRLVITYLIDSILHERINTLDVREIISVRKRSFWYSGFANVYASILNASEFLAKLDLVDLKINDMDSGLTQYSNSYYEIDQLYRKFIYNFKQTHSNSSLLPLVEKIENLYSNNFLLDLNNNWQACFDNARKTQYIRQRDFYKLCLESKLERSKQVVIISDALRFEIAKELLARVQSENRYVGEISLMQGEIPSYTQLGMASLLPHSQLQIDAESMNKVYVDGMSSGGLDNRNKILQKHKNKSIAFNYNDINKMSSEEIKQVCVDYKLIYVYHNLIDATGDKLNSEDKLPQAVENTLEQLTGLVKKIGGGNRITNFIITADHGFLYQNSKVEESDFLDVDIKAEGLNRNRRFIIGKGLRGDSRLMKFTSEDLKLGSGLDILIPKSINKLRLQGSGSRFVHGGASLQEIVIPLVFINKSSRIDDISQVEVDVLSKGSNSITTGQLSLTLYQTEPVTQKKQAKSVRVGLYSEKDELLSDVHDIVLNSESDISRERETKVKLILNDKANDYNNKDIYLKLKHKLSGTNKYADYKSYPYFLKRALFTDF